MAESEQPTQSPPTESFGIVVLGTMNPRLHHPIWYKAIGLLNDAELAESVKMPLVCSAETAMFNAAGFTVSCAPDRWDIVTIFRPNRPRILEVAKEVFKRLHETPINLFAFNNDFALKTQTASVRSAMAERISKARFTSPSNRVDHASLIFSYTVDDTSLTHVRVEPHETYSDHVYVAVNTNHRLISAEGGHFDLSPLLDKYCEADFAQAIAQTNTIVQTFNERD